MLAPFGRYAVARHSNADTNNRNSAVNEQGASLYDIAHHTRTGIQEPVSQYGRARHTSTDADASSAPPRANRYDRANHASATTAPGPTGMNLSIGAEAAASTSDYVKLYVAVEWRVRTADPRC